MENKQVNERKINLSISEGEPFFSHEMSINFNPTQFILDFKCVTPRVDPRTRDGTAVLSLKHNVVMIEPYHAKQMLNALGEVIEKYEKKFGKIKIPSALAQIEKEVQKKSKTKKSEDGAKTGKFPSYLG